MVEALRYNLFRFAPRELSHSAFWAWMFQSLDAAGEPSLRGPRAVALRLLKAHDIPSLRPPVRVVTEQWLNKRDRLDIRITDADGTIVVVENKVLATPDAEQVKRYLAGLAEGGRAYLLVLSTAFDDDVRASLECEYVGMPELLKVLRPYRTSHFLISEYFDWLRALSHARARLARDAHSDAPQRHATALRTAAGQWALMKTLTRGMKGTQYRGMGLGGKPWTQFGFVEQSPRHDKIFYRLDHSAEGYQLRINQYRDDVDRKEEAVPKMRRLAKLRSWWSEACDRCGTGLSIAEYGDRGVKESTIGRLLLRDNPPSRLVTILPVLHKAFVRKLTREGWPVTS